MQKDPLLSSVVSRKVLRRGRGAWDSTVGKRRQRCELPVGHESVSNEFGIRWKVGQAADKDEKACNSAGLRYLRFLYVALIILLEDQAYAGKGRGAEMSDIIFVLATVVFFGLSILYLKGCERLK
jgi:hypothetical protein